MGNYMDGSLTIHVFLSCALKKSEQFLGSFDKNIVQQSSMDQVKYTNKANKLLTGTVIFLNELI